MFTSTSSFVGTLIRGEASKEGKEKKYDGITHRFSFGAETEIYLVGVTFLGLHKSAKFDKEDASIYLKIEESVIFNDLGPRATLLPRKHYPVGLKKDGKTTVELPYPVRIRKGVWVDVGFQIEGPGTQVMEEMSMAKITHKSQDGLVRFHTTYSRSPLQMPRIHYLLP